MNITFYNCDKKLNSTMVPVSSSTFPAVTKSCVLKDDCDNLRPSFELVRDSTVLNPNYNMLSWAETSALTRYYYITGRTYLSNNMVRIDCELDVLATYKTYIGQKQFFVTRSASARNQTIADMFYPTKLDKQFQASGNFPLSDDGGFYVIGVVQDVSLGIYGENYSFRRGSVYYYTAMPDEMKDLLAFLQSPDVLSDGNAHAYGDYDPLSHVVSCVYIPIVATGLSKGSIMFHYEGDPNDPTKEDMFVWSHTVIDDVDIDTGILESTKSLVPLPNHPQASTVGAYMNYAPFSRYMLYAGPFGAIELDRSMFQNSNTMMYVDFTIDCANGMANMRLYEYYAPNTALAYSFAQIGVEVLLAQQVSFTKSDLMRMENMKTEALAGIASNVITAAAAGNPLPLIGAATSAINLKNSYALASYMASIPKVSMVSNNGNMANIAVQWRVESEFSLVADDSIQWFGGPLFEDTYINSLVGYVQCSGAHYDGICSTREEREAIDGFLNGGFFYE